METDFELFRTYFAAHSLFLRWSVAADRDIVLMVSGLLDFCGPKNTNGTSIADADLAAGVPTSSSLDVLQNEVNTCWNWRGLSTTAGLSWILTCPAGSDGL